MSYTPGTQLTRKTPFADGTDDAAYNEIEIIGQSSIQGLVRTGEWAGQLGDSISIRPMTAFGPVIDLPYGEIQRDYEITFLPPRETVRRQVIEQPMPGPSPEEQFAAVAAEQAAARPKRGRTAPAPVGNVEREDSE